MIYCRFNETGGIDMSRESERRAMHSNTSDRVEGAHGGFRNLKAYQVAELCYDFTCRFCERYVSPRDRHFDQMAQASAGIT